MAALISIDRIALSDGQVMTLRVALAYLVSSMAESGALGGDEIGKQIAEGYLQSAGDILRMIDAR